jgi:hypothetical protein
LRNAVFALGATFLELVSPVRDDAPAARFLQRRGEDGGYMVMIQVESLAAVRERAAGLGIREVLAIERDEIAEVHLHPADMRGAIVSLSEPRPPDSWCWGGAGWCDRAAAGAVSGVRLALADPDGAEQRWRHLLGGQLPDGLELRPDAGEGGLVQIAVAGTALETPLAVGGVTVIPQP